MNAKIISLIKDRPFQSIGIVIAIATAILTYLGYANSSQQLELAKIQASLRPHLIYSISQISESNDESAIQAAQVELKNAVFKAAISRVEKNPQEDFAKALDAVLPISTTVSFSPSGVSIKVINNGNGTATKIRVATTLQSGIGDVKVNANEPYSIIRGGVGQKTVHIEIDRLTFSSSAEVTVWVQGIGGKSQALLVAEKSTTARELNLIDVFGGFKSLEKKFDTSKFQYQQAVVTKGGESQGRSFVTTPITFALYRPIIISPEVSVTSNEVTGEQSR